MAAADCNAPPPPPTKPNVKTATTGTTTTIPDTSIGSLAFSPTFPMPFLADNTTTAGLVNANAKNTVPYEPLNLGLPRFILEGGSSNCSSSHFCPSHQESSPFVPLMDGNYGIPMDEYSYQLLSSIWSQEEEAFGAVDGNADLFSIFHVDSKPHGVSQSL
ncbi:hypothetical protein Salat_2904400 [Sesamum alatum]|uniref:Uncharacterized protein n=1 Tax=Sesamum alatum TaxID=300844 RepID=A0AAE1XJH9_9LAMI|nr:hypothetical protein Salat_2904400 [Sesamum alatum]